MCLWLPLKATLFFFPWLSAFRIDFFGHACETSCLRSICWGGALFIDGQSSLNMRSVTLACVCCRSFVVLFVSLCSLHSAFCFRWLHFLGAEASVIIGSDSAGLSFKKKFYYILNFIYCYCVFMLSIPWRVCEGQRTATGAGFLLHRMGPWCRTQVSGLGTKAYLHLLSHLATPRNGVFSITAKKKRKEK